MSWTSLWYGQKDSVLATGLCCHHCPLSQLLASQGNWHQLVLFISLGQLMVSAHAKPEHLAWKREPCWASISQEQFQLSRTTSQANVDRQDSAHKSLGVQKQTRILKLCAHVNPGASLLSDSPAGSHASLTSMMSSASNFLSSLSPSPVLNTTLNI